nr:hypothetical protein Iba_chr14dCG6180 [Ipomoea batatas]
MAAIKRSSSSCNTHPKPMALFFGSKEASVFNFSLPTLGTFHFSTSFNLGPWHNNRTTTSPAWTTMICVMASPQTSFTLFLSIDVQKGRT